MPPSGKSPVRVGPQDVDSAGDLVGRLGTHNRGGRLIQQMAARYPAELVTAQMLEADDARTEYLDADEVLEHARSEFGGRKAVQTIESARVRGKGRKPDDLVVTIAIGVKSGRIIKQFFPYSDLPKSAKAYEKAEADGLVGADQEQDAESLSAALAATRAELAAIRKENRAADDATESDADLVDGNADEVKDRIENWDAEELSRALAAERAGKKRKTVAEAIEAELEARAQADDSDGS